MIRLTTHPDDFDFHEELYKKFLPEIKTINDSDSLRQGKLDISQYNPKLDSLIVAGSLYGVASRIGLEILPTSRNSPEELAIRRNLRGETFFSEINRVHNLSHEEVAKELEEQGVSKRELDDLTAKIEKIVGGKLKKPKKPKKEEKDIYRVTGIDALFKIEGPTQRTVAYCRVHTPKQYEDVAVGWDNPVGGFLGSPEFQDNLLFEFESLGTNDAFDRYLVDVANVVLFVKMGKYDDEDVNGILALIHGEA